MGGGIGGAGEPGAGSACPRTLTRCSRSTGAATGLGAGRVPAGNYGLSDATQGLTRLDLRDQEVIDMEVARRLQEEEILASNKDKHAAQVAQDEVRGQFSGNSHSWLTMLSPTHALRLSYPVLSQLQSDSFPQHFLLLLLSIWMPPPLVKTHVHRNIKTVCESFIICLFCF
uniref:Uncharacterized protein n=1 Tax=Gadus morhua TaxID=8049 RepID=A0A8C5C8Q6_GADMO